MTSTDKPEGRDLSIEKNNDGSISLTLAPDKKPHLVITRQNDDGSVTVILPKPIITQNGEVTEIHVRKPKAIDLLAMDKGVGEIGKTMALAQQLTGIHMPLIKAMEAPDFLAISRVIQGFLAPSPETGE
jgi:hypothetical protein